jgi:hypothetical protein
MVGEAGTRLCSLLLLACLGCLDAPPGHTSEDDEPADAAVSLRDAGSCPAIVTPPFDDTARWLPTQPDSSTVIATAEQVVLSLTEDAGQDAYADLHSLAAAGIDGTTLTATLRVSTASNAWAGISWHAKGDVLDYYDLAVREGVLYARVKSEAGQGMDTCSGGACPPYDPEDPPMLRLQAADGVVHYQISGDGSLWEDIGTAAVRDLDYKALLFVTTNPLGSAAMTVSAAEWVECLP